MLDESAASGLLVRCLLFMFPDRHKYGHNCADGGKTARHQPITGNVAEAVDNSRLSKAEGYNKRMATEVRATYLRISELTAVLALLISP